MPSSMDALRRANPRAAAGFAESVAAADRAVRSRLAAAEPVQRPPRALRGGPRLRRVLPAAAAAAVLAAGVATLVPNGPPPDGTGSSAAAVTVDVRRAAAATAEAADVSGTVTVRMTHGGQPWAGKTVRWNGDDLQVVNEPPESGRELRVVDGTMYAPDPERDGGWVQLGPPDSVDPDSGTTPAEYLRIVREDVGGVGLRRIVDAMTGISTQRLDDGATRSTGRVPAGALAPETGVKQGQAIRVLPFGYVAHDEAHDPASLLDTAVTVAPNGIIREIAVTWGSGADAWTYTVTYTDLGATPSPEAPAGAEPLRR